MNIKNNVEIMKIIEQKERKQLEILKEKNKSNIDIIDTIFLGEINGENIYRVAEDDNKDNYTAVLYKYFDESGKVIGIKNVRPDGFKQWISIGEEREELRDEIDKNEVLLEEIEEELLKQGITKEQIRKVDEIETLGHDKKKEDDNGEKKNKTEATNKYTNVLNEVDTNKDIDQKGTELGEALGLEEYGYTKLLIVHAYNTRDIKDKNGESFDAATKKIWILGERQENGKQIVEPIPESILEYKRINNDSSVRFDDNAKVEKNTNVTEMFVNPRNNKGIIIEMSEMETKVYYQSGIDKDDNTAVAGRVEDGRTGWIEAETKEIFNYNHGEYQQDKVNAEMDTHGEDKGKIPSKDADGDLNTVTHLHEIDANSQIIYNGSLMSVEEVAQLPEFKVSAKYFVELYNKKVNELKGKDNINVDEIYKEIEEDINGQMQGPKNR